MSKRTHGRGSLRKSTSNHEKSSDTGLTMGDFFAPRQRTRTTRHLSDDENVSTETSAVDVPQVSVDVKTENVRRSSRLSAQAAAAAIARALQVTAR